jgi:hypothetical protein
MDVFKIIRFKDKNQISLIFCLLIKKNETLNCIKIGFYIDIYIWIWFTN